MNLQNMQIPSPDNNIVAVQLIEQGGNLVIEQYDTASAIDREVTKRTFYTRDKAVQKWMEKAPVNSHLFVYVKAKEMWKKKDVQNAVTVKDRSSLTSPLVAVVVIVTTTYESKMSQHRRE